MPADEPGQPSDEPRWYDRAAIIGKALVLLLLLIFCSFFLGAMTVNTITLKDQIQEHNILTARSSSALSEYLTLKNTLSLNQLTTRKSGQIGDGVNQQANDGVLIKLQLLENQILTDHLRRGSISRDLCRISFSAIRKLNNLLGVGPTKEMADQCKSNRDEADKDLASLHKENFTIEMILRPSLRELGLKKLAQETLNLFSTFVLPFFYGMLGCALGLFRDPMALANFPAFSIKNKEKEEIDVRTYIAGLGMGGLAGMVVGWFLQPLSQTTVQTVSEITQVFQQPQLSLFPFGIAFLVGYRVEILFKIMDRLEYLALGEKETDKKK